MTRNQKRQRGSTLIVVLVVTVIFALLAAAMGALILGHNTRASVDRNAAQALDAAECGLNYQVQRIFANMYLGDAQIAYSTSTNNINAATYGLVAAPIPVTAKDATANSTTTTLNTRLNLNTSNSPADYCVCWIEFPGQPTRALTTSTSDEFYIYGQARVNGVVRTVRAKAASIDIFKRWAMFGNAGVNIQGSFTVTPTAASPGPNGELGVVGSNGTIDIAKNGAAIGGQIIYGTGAPDPDFSYTEGGKRIDLPPINELAEAAYREGTSLASGIYPANNANSGIAKFALNNDNQGKSLASKNNSTPTPLNTNGTFPNGGYGYPLKLSSTVGRATNFYLSGLDGPGTVIWADVSNGPINLWVNCTKTGNAANESLSGNIDIVAYKQLDGMGQPIRLLGNSPLFHIYYSNQNGRLNITGGGSTQNIFAMLYFFNTTSDGTPFGTFTTGGTVTVNGAVIGNTLGDGSGGGNFQVNYPSTVGAGGNTEGALFGLNTPWTEYDPVVGN
jgi:Tfp pilus assembly protein PilX